MEVTGLTAARMLEIEAASVVDGAVVGDNLILTRQDATTIDAGVVRGADGAPGAPGPSALANGDVITWGVDVNLYRHAANVLRTDDTFVTPILMTGLGTAGQVQVSETGVGAGIFFGLAADTNLYRSAANTLKTDSQMVALGGGFSIGFLTTQGIRAVYSGAEQTTMGAVGPASQSGLIFGLSGDTNLYRSAANVLKTDDDFHSALNIQALGGNIAARASAATIVVAGDVDGVAGLYFGSAGDTKLKRGAANSLRLDSGDSFQLGSGTSDGSGGFIEFWEQTADPAAGAANTARLFAKDNGAGKTQIGVRFPSGATQILATEP